MHNPNAGDGSQPSGERIVEMIEDAGHKVKYQSSKEKNWTNALKKNCDMIVVAGGDGTVGKVARRMVGSTVPVAILPLGTANNMAHAMGLTGRAIEAQIAEWETARRISFDIGKAEGPWGSQYFVEGVGIGLFAATILNIEKRKDRKLAAAASREEEITRVLELFKQQVQKHRPERIKVRLDDEDLSDDYLLIQASNIRYIGPNLDLAPGADTNDGLLDVVLIRPGEEDKLSKYLARCIKGKNAKAGLTVHRGRHLLMEADGSPVHLDDKAWPPEKLGKTRSKRINIEVSPHSIFFLCPQKTRRRPRRPSG